MYTIAILTKRKPGVSESEFYGHYRTRHFDLATRMPGLISYQQAQSLHGEEMWPSPEFYADYDALSLYSFESYESARASFASFEGEAVNADADEFIEADSVLFFPVAPIQRFDRKAKEQS